jgi:hypothetical protein
MRPEDELEETEKKTAEEAVEKAAEETAEEAVEEAGEEAPEETASGGKKNYWWLALSFLFLFLAGGGYYALTSMGKEAQKLAGGDSYNQLSSNSAAYNRGSLEKADNYFSSDEEDPLSSRAEVAASAAATEKRRAHANRALAASGGDAGPGSSGYAGGGEEDEEDYDSRAGAGRRGAFEGKLEARASGLGGLRGAGAAKTASGFNSGGEQSAGGAGVTAGRPSVQRETAAGAPKKAAPGGVLSALKGAFRASLYGARIASKDSARHWMARTFDAAGDVNTALEYDEKMKASLDRIDPNSIPKFLRDQDITASDAKSLGVAEVGKPKMDVEGTKEALKNDKDYQSRKMMQDMASAAMNPLGNFVGANTGRAATPSEEEASEEDRNVTGFSSPEDEAAFREISLQEYMNTSDNWCCPNAQCCCLPQNTVTTTNTNLNCPMYGPFLPNDPCAAGFYNTSLVGDFPPPNMSQMPA